MLELYRSFDLDELTPYQKSLALVLLERARHFLFEDEPEHYAREVNDFLDHAGI